ncbi:MAG TPA: hypothetical protein DDW42_02620 [Desulfobacteraceae bacterium]|nr:hypothetical protein [Desulfobacteraceae bacterium]
MIIALAADDNNGMDAVLSHHFGRCPHYIFVEVEGEEIKDVKSAPNPFYESHGDPGQVPSFIKSQGAHVMIAGGMGPKAIGFFQEFGIESVTGASGKVKEAVDAYLGKRLAGAQPCSDHDNLTGPDERVSAPGGFEGDEVSRLREEIVALRRQMAEIQERQVKLQQEKN